MRVIAFLFAVAGATRLNIHDIQSLKNEESYYPSCCGINKGDPLTYISETDGHTRRYVNSEGCAGPSGPVFVTSPLGGRKQYECSQVSHSLLQTDEKDAEEFEGEYYPSCCGINKGDPLTYISETDGHTRRYVNSEGCAGPSGPVFVTSPLGGRKQYECYQVSHSLVETRADTSLFQQGLAMLAARARVISHISALNTPGAMCRMIMHMPNDGHTLCELGEQLGFEMIAEQLAEQKVPGVTEACNAEGMKKICSGDSKLECSDFLDQMIGIMSANPPPDAPADFAKDPKGALCSLLPVPEEELAKLNEQGKAMGITCTAEELSGWCK